MRIALCDDEIDFTTKLKNQLYEYSNNHNWDSAIDVYNSGKDLIESKTKYDIIIIDYQMDDLNGLQTAKILRDGINHFSCIIFLTSYPEIAISAYDVDTYRFVVKNTLFDGIYKALDDFRNTIKLDYDIIVKTNNEFVTVNTKDIVFIEVQNKFCYIHLFNNSVLITRRTLKSLYLELPKTHFAKIHKSFIINFAHILERSNTFLTVRKLNMQLPISRNYLSKFNSSYYTFLKDYKT